jgi:hypothetical protein
MINQKMIAVVDPLLNWHWLLHAVFSLAKKNRPHKAAGGIQSKRKKPAARAVGGIQSKRKKTGRASGRRDSVQTKKNRPRERPVFRLLTKGD